MRIWTVEEAKARARREKLRLEPTHNVALKSRAAAERKVPRGGMLVRSGRDWIAMGVVR